MNTGEPLPGNKGSRFHRYLQYADGILEAYRGQEPLHLYLKKYFSANKKHGSSDRKMITLLCYYFFRLGFGVTASLEKSQKIVLSTFLIEKNNFPFLAALNPIWNEKISLPVSEKLLLVKDIFDVENIFPFREELSDEIDYHLFNLSFLIQPALFIRIRLGFRKSVEEKLQAGNISFEKMNDDCLSFSNNQKLADVINMDEEAVVQDYNSQRTVSLLMEQLHGAGLIKSVWDCCAASGGKSILAFDVLKNIEITVSDTRKNILKNLHLRFSKAGIKKYESFIFDLSVPSLKMPAGKFDLIIADVPCTGSGTWARSPEQLHFFSKENIDKYALLQRKIVSNAVTALSEEGYFLYITCSVFKKENEGNVDYIQRELGLTLIKSEYLKGYTMQADTLFAAVFKK